MYTQQQKEAALKAYIANNKNATLTVRQLGYPTVPALIKWYREYHPPVNPKPKRPKRRYTEEEKKKAVDLCLENGCNIKGTVRKLGYGSSSSLLLWLREMYPEKASKPIPRDCKVNYPENVKQQAMIDLLNHDMTSSSVAEKYGISCATLYEWKINYLGRGRTDLKEKSTPMQTEDYIEEIRELQRQKDLVEQELIAVKKQLYKAHLEKDVYEKAAEILKKEMACSLKDFTNREKAMVIAALKDKYHVSEILEVFDMAKSSYFYQKEQLSKQDKYELCRTRIIELFKENKGRYGYRRIHALLKREGKKLSEKIVRRIMKEEHLIVKTTRRRKYSSYRGEISPAVENKIKRNFHADSPNEKWLTDITEFSIGKEEKVYLSPIIDCFDGLPVTWTIGTSPNAKLVNRMLDNAIETLKDSEHPIVHSDRGCHYRWPGWIRRMDEAGLIRSMSKKGCSPDNSACEGFFGRLKIEMFYGYDWSNVSVFDFIKILDDYLKWYREELIKLSLGGMSPMEYRRSLGLA